MKILMLNSITNQSGGGIQLWSMAQHMARLGCEVLFLERVAPRTKRRESSRIHYGAVRDTGLLGLDVLRATAMNLWRGLLFKPEYVFVLKPMPNTCIPALLLKVISKSTVILDIDDLDFAYYSNSFKQGLVRSWFSWFPQHFDLISTPSVHLKDYILKDLHIPRERVYFLAQGIESERFLKASPNEFYRRKYGIEGNDMVIVYSASLGMTSDFEYILPMLIKFLQEYDDAKILVIGDGSKREHFRREVKARGLQRRMIFTGYVPHGDMPGILKLARVGINYMAPSWANQCRASIKIREYLAAGLSVVCNTVGDAELFKDYVTLCSSVEEFPAAMRQALTRQNLESSRRGQEFVIKTFSWPCLVESFVEYLERISNEG
jgi:glycosyltransferase involved in cell wall biosynthesis